MAYENKIIQFPPPTGGVWCLKKLSYSAVCSCVFLCSVSINCGSQNFAVKTNLLYDATATFNGGVEFRLAPKWTMDVSANLNPWTLKENRRIKHWLVQPEARWWFCDAWMGSFLAIHALGGQFNVGGWDIDMNVLGTDFRKIKDHRYQGWMAGAGLGYGYAWVLGKNWNFEIEGGIGWMYGNYDTFRCAGCGKKIDENTGRHYFGPTKFALSLVYLF